MYMHTYRRFCNNVVVSCEEQAGSAGLQSACTRSGSRCERTLSLLSHHNETVIYIFSGYIQEAAGSPLHRPPIIIIILILVCESLSSRSLVFLRLIG